MNEPARPTAVRSARRRCGPFRSTVSAVHIPHTPGSSRQALVFLQRSWFRYIPAAAKTLQPLRSHQDRLILVDAHPRRPLVGRVPARHAHTCHAPSGSAAGASRHPLGQTPGVLLRLSPSQLLTLGLEWGMHFAASAAPVLANPPPTPTPAHGTHCPPMAATRPAPSAQAPPARRGSAFGAQSLRRVSVPPDFSGPVPSVHSPLHPSDSALCSARCLPAISTS